MAIIRTKVGVSTSQDGAYPEWRGTRKGAGLIQDTAGRFEESALRGSLFSASVGGAGQTLVAVNLFSTAIATFQPIFALYNPTGNAKLFAILKAWCGVVAAPLATGAQTGAFLFLVGSQQVITNAGNVTPINHVTFKAAGSSGIAVLNAVLTGAVGNPLLLRPLNSVINLVTATANASQQYATLIHDETEAAILIPPGGYLAMATGISNTVDTVIAGMTWEELPFTS